MRFFQFIKWTFKYNFEVCVMIFFLLLMAVILMLPPVIPLPLSIISISYLFILCIILIMILREVVRFISRCWNDFNDHCPTEDIALMRKLKGIPTPAKPSLHDSF